MLHWRKCRDLFESLGSIDFSGSNSHATESSDVCEWYIHRGMRIECPHWTLRQHYVYGYVLCVMYLMIWKLVFIRTYAVIVTRTTSKMFQNGDTAGVYIFIDTRRGMCSFRKQLKYNWVYKDYCSIVKTRRHPTDYTFYCTNIFFNCSVVDDFT